MTKGTKDQSFMKQNSLVHLVYCQNNPIFYQSYHFQKDLYQNFLESVVEYLKLGVSRLDALNKSPIDSIYISLCSGFVISCDGSAGFAEQMLYYYSSFSLQVSLSMLSFCSILDLLHLFYNHRMNYHNVGYILTFKAIYLVLPGAINL